MSSVMYPKEFVAGFRAISGAGRPHRVLAGFLADWFEQVPLPSYDTYLTKHLPQLIVDAWEELRTSPNPSTRDVRDQLMRAENYRDGMPAITGFAVGDTFYARDLLCSIIGEVYERVSGSHSGTIRIEMEIMAYLRAQETMLLQTLHEFMRIVWRRGLYDTVKYERRAVVRLGQITIRTVILANNMSLAFIKGAHELHFVGGPNDPLGVEFIIVDMSNGVHLDKARTIIMAATEMGAKLIDRAPGTKVFHVEKA